MPKYRRGPRRLCAVAAAAAAASPQAADGAAGTAHPTSGVGWGAAAAGIASADDAATAPARANGKTIGGTLGFQYALYIYDPQYCYGARLYEAAVDDRNFKAAMRTVRRVWDGTAYSGPGLPINPNTGLP